MKRIPRLILPVFLSIAAAGCTNSVQTVSSAENAISENTDCDDKACVAQYLHVYDHLPSNFMTKDEAREQGWTGGALHLTIPGMCIGGDEFGNYEESLPVEDTYHECDIDTLHSDTRGGKRIVWSNDGDIWYTGDHYETWMLLYGDGE